MHKNNETKTLQFITFCLISMDGIFDQLLHATHEPISGQEILPLKKLSFIIVVSELKCHHETSSFYDLIVTQQVKSILVLFWKYLIGKCPLSTHTFPLQTTSGSDRWISIQILTCKLVPNIFVVPKIIHASAVPELFVRFLTDAIPISIKSQQLTIWIYLFPRWNL